MISDCLQTVSDIAFDTNIALFIDIAIYKILFRLRGRFYITKNVSVYIKFFSLVNFSIFLLISVHFGMESRWQ